MAENLGFRVEDLGFMVYLLGVSREYGNLLYGDYICIYIYIHFVCVVVKIMASFWIPKY